MFRKKIYFALMFMLLAAQTTSANLIVFKSIASRQTKLAFSVADLSLEKSTNHWQIFASPRYQIAHQDGYIDSKIITSLIDHYTLQRSLDLREVGIAYNTDYFELGFGKKIFNWSQALEINPIDLVNPRDFTDLLEWEKIGVAGTWIKLYLSDWGLTEGITNFFVPARLPMHPENQWFLPVPDNIIMQDRVLPPKENLQHSGRLSVNLLDLDLSLVGHYGYNPFPYFKLINILPNEQIMIAPVYYRRYIAGLSASKVMPWNLVLRTETAYFVPEKKTQDDSYVQTVISFDRFWPNIIKSNNLHILMQYARELVIAKGQNPSPNNWSRIFKNHLGGQISWDINSNWQIKLKSIYGLEDKESFSQIFVEYKLLDKMRLNIALDILEGPKKSFFGQYNSQDRIKINIKYDF